jgi:di/tricarboxylate transporter
MLGAHQPVLRYLSVIKTNLMVYGWGIYHLKTFLKNGIPMKIIAAVIAIVIIPLVWPL